MMESRKADQEEEKQARDTIRQRIEDDKVPLILTNIFETSIFPSICCQKKPHGKSTPYSPVLSFWTRIMVKQTMTKDKQEKMPRTGEGSGP